MRESTIRVTCGAVASRHGASARAAAGRGTAPRGARRNGRAATAPRRARATDAARHARGARPPGSRASSRSARSPSATDSDRRPSRCTTPRAHRVHGRAVRRGDVDPEMERPRRPGDARIVEVAAHRVRPVERLQRPRVHAPQYRPGRGTAAQPRAVEPAPRARPVRPSRAGTRRGTATFRRLTGTSGTRRVSSV